MLQMEYTIKTIDSRHNVLLFFFSFHDRCGIETNSIAYKISMVDFRQDGVVKETKVHYLLCLLCVEFWLIVLF
jgi:hypothetical protein